MPSICTACENYFDGDLNELLAWQLPGVKCLERAAPHLCENSKCKYYYDEEDDYGCTMFFTCDQCLSSPEAIRQMLKNYDDLVGKYGR